MELIAEWLSDLRRSYTDEPIVTDVRLGVFYTAVEISTGDVGVASTPRDLHDTVCCPTTAAGAPPAGRLIGVKASETAEYALSSSAPRRAIGVATLNALSAAATRRYGFSEGVVREDVDALDATGVAPDDAVAMVGAFIPFIKKLKGRVADLRVIDKHREALKPKSIRDNCLFDHISPPGKFSRRIGASDSITMRAIAPEGQMLNISDDVSTS